MGKKCNCPPEGAPEWVLTYGDMMSLLLCFFIILVALSEIKKEDQYMAIVAEVKKAFGMHGGGGAVPSDMPPEMSLIKRLEKIRLQQQKEKNTSHADDPGITGKQPTVTKVRDGKQFVVGGRIEFEQGSARLSQEAKSGLARVAELIRGHNNIVEIGGHTSRSEPLAGTAYADLYALSFARSKAVMDYLTGDELKIRRERIRLVGNADFEPLSPRPTSDAERRPNRRAEIVVTETLVQDMKQPAI